MSHQQNLFDTEAKPWELDSQSECRAAKVVFAEPPHGPLDYLVPDEFSDLLQAGMRVKVPLGKSNRELLGYCIKVESIQAVPESLKPVREVLDAPRARSVRGAQDCQERSADA